MWVATPSTCELRKLNRHETVYTEIRCCKQNPSTSPGVALPLLSMIGHAQWSIEKLLGQLSRQFIEQLPVLSLESGAGSKHPGRHAGAVRWHGTQRGVIARGLSQGPLPAGVTHGDTLGGVMKNAIAIASRIAAGRGLGENARASLITLGFAETIRLGLVKGAKVATFTGLSGVGNFMLTASSLQSRNTSLSVQLGEGRCLADIMAERKEVTEGFYSVEAVAAFARQLHLDMPVAQALRKAQLAFIDAFPNKSHPYYWSGFEVTGNYSALR